MRCVGDLTASSILAGPANPVIGWKILQVYNDGFFSEMAALSVMLVLISGTFVVTVLTLASESGPARRLLTRAAERRR